MIRPGWMSAFAVVVIAVAGSALAADEPKIVVHRLTFSGVRQVDESLLRAALATQGSSRLPWGKKKYFDRARFQADLQRIHAFYADRGFPDARVASFDIALNQDSTRVDLRIHVTEGEPIRVGALTFKGFEDVPPRPLAGFKRRAPVKVGAPLDRAAVATMREAAMNLLRDHGYPWPAVTVDQVTRAPRDVELQFVANPGFKACFGDAEVTGAFEVSESLIRRELLFQPGDPYRLSVVQESQRKLYDLELFQFVSIRPLSATSEEGKAEAEANGGRVPMRVTVAENKHRHVNLSVGYGTEDKARVEARLRQLNVFGGARTGELHGKWSSLDRGLQFQFTNPYFFAPRWSLELTGQQWYEYEPLFKSRTSGGHATFSYRPGTANVVSLTLTDLYQSSRISNEALADLSLRPTLISLGLDPRTGMQDGTLTALAIDARRTTARNPLNSRNGYVVALHLEKAGGIVRGDYNYTNASIDARQYVPLPGRVVLAGRLQFGAIRPYGGDEAALVPFAKRYFLGGADSLRGWGRYDVSPLSGSGLPIGGLTMLAATLEVRGTVWGQLGGVLFVDAGNVWSDPWIVKAHDLRYDVGPGLRYTTPIGPLRIDLGYQLNPIPGLLVNGKPESRRWRVHFSIGQAF